MATVDKNFRIKNGLVVEGSTATVNGSNILTENSTEFIQDTAAGLITGGTHTNITATYNDSTGTLDLVGAVTYTDEQAQDAVGNAVGTGLSYNDSTGAISVDTTAIQAKVANVSDTEIGYLDGVTSAIQTQLNNKSATGHGHTSSDISDFTEAAQDAVGNSLGSGLSYNDSTGAISVDTTAIQAKVANVSDTEIGYLDGVTSAIQTQLNAKEDALTAAQMVNKVITEVSGSSYGLVGTSVYLDVKDTNGYNKEIELDIAAVKTQLNTDGYITTSSTSTLTNKTLTSPKINEDVALTATATELNILDGATLSTTELNYVDGVTSSIQTQINNKQDKVSGVSDTEIGYLDGVTSGIQTQIDSKLSLSGGTMTGAIAMGTNKITGLGTPTSSTDAATKAYVDSVTEGLHIHESVVAATTTNVNLANALENGDTLDGVTLATGNRILVKNQTTTSENGIYVVQASGQPVRATDFDTATEVDSGDFVFVYSGTANASTGWVQTNKPATIGTDPITFTQFSGAGTYLAGNGLTLTGNTFTIDTSITQTRVANVSDTEIGYLDGVTSAIQTQLNAKFDSANASTSNITEGTNLYFTDERAQDAVGNNVGTGLSYNDGTGAISVTANTYDAYGAASTAQTNAETTAANALSAVTAGTTAFTAVNINSVAKQVAATTGNIVTAAATTAYAWAKASYRSGEFLVKSKNGDHTELSKIMVTLDTSDNISITEYGMSSTSGTALQTVSADISGTDVRIRVTPANNNTEVLITGTLLV